MTNLSFLTTEKPGTGFGVKISTAKTVEEALTMSGLNWTVESRPIAYQSPDGSFSVLDQRCNVRVEDGKSLGIVSDRYKICQNAEAFDFLNNLVDAGDLQFDMAGSFFGGRRVWIQAKIGTSKIFDDEIDQYVIFINSHDGSTSIRAMILPIRIACSNALNYAISKASRSWSCTHAGDLSEKLLVAQKTLIHADEYMAALTDDVKKLNDIKLSDAAVEDMIITLFPDVESLVGQRNVERMRSAVTNTFYHKEDLQSLPKSGHRFMSAISDVVMHNNFHKQTTNYNERLYSSIINGHPIIDKAHNMVMAAA